MEKNHHWSTGETIVFRGLALNKIWTALPVFVVQDRPDFIAFFWPAGTHGKWRMKPSGEKVTPHDILFTSMELIDRTWEKTDVLMLIKPGEAHAIYAMWEEGHKKQLCWYVNLQDPISRTLIGFDTSDHMLDVVFSPDRLFWQWKDESQLEDAVSIGLVTTEVANKIRAEGEKAIAKVRANQSPICDGWENWSPPQDWGIPELSSDWDLGFRD